MIRHNMILTVLIIAAALLRIGSGDDVIISADIDNEAPIASSALLNGGSTITLTAGQTTNVEATVTVTDNNGCAELTGVEGKLFRSDKMLFDVDEGRTHYTQASCAQESCGGVTAYYTCSFNVEHYATPTDGASNFSSLYWNFTATPSDADGPGISDSDDEEVSTLTALTVNTSALDFGTMELGSDSGNDSLTTLLSNDGNEALDILLQGTDLSCTVGSIPVGNVEYSAANFTYGSGDSLMSSDVELDLDLDRGTDAVQTPSKDVYFGLGIPSSGLAGACSGTVTITAQSDPTLD